MYEIKTSHAYDIWDDNDGQTAYLFCNIPWEEMVVLEQAYKDQHAPDEEGYYDHGEFVKWLQSKQYTVVIVNRPEDGINLNN